LPSAPLLFSGVGQASVKSALLLPVKVLRCKLKAAVPGVSAVGVPEVGVPSCVEVLVGPV